MITSYEFNRNIKKFNKLEKRGTFYEMFIKLIKNDYDIEAYFLILSTWNFAGFRYAINDFDIVGFKKVIKNKCNPIFNRLKKKELKTVNFNEISKDVKELYNILSSIKGIKYTGAPKLMHIKNPKLFVMWDSYIKGYYGFRKGTAEDYVNFLKKMQEMFKDIKWKNKNRTLAKVIDEYNYVNITLPALKKIKNKN